MDHSELKNENLLAIDKDAQIQVLVNNTDDEDTIDIGNILHNAKKKAHVYRWVLLLFLAVGVSAALLHYQFTKPFLTVSSVVTLNYDVPLEEPGMDPEEPEFAPVEDLTAPDGTPLDLNQVTSSYVLQTALEGLELSQLVTITQLRDNIQVDRILTEDSRRQQEVASNMIQDKNTGAYTQVQEIELTYVNRFVVSLTNGFGEENSRTKLELKDSELRLVLDRILDAYNRYLVTTYADVKLPEDEISVIDIDNLELLESLDLLRTATQNLYDFCDEKQEAVKSYRSWRTGLSLNDLMDLMQIISTNNVEYLYSYAYTNSIVVDRNVMLTNYQYELRTVQSQLDVVNKNIDTNSEMLKTYQNDEIFVTMQESDTSKSTKTTKDYYNKLIIEQANNYEKAAELETKIADLQDKISSLEAGDTTADIEKAMEELRTASNLMKGMYRKVLAHFEEINEVPTFTTYAEHSVSQGKTKNFLAASAKKLVLAAAVALVLGCGLWFLGALLPELTGRSEEDKEKSGKRAEKENAGKEDVRG